MPVVTTKARNVKIGNGTTTVFPFDFEFLLDATIKVTLIVDATGVKTVQVLTTDYTLTGGGGATGSVTMIVAPATGETLVIERVEVFTQAVDYTRLDPFPAEVNEDALNKLTYLVQQVLDAQQRNLALDIDSTLTALTLEDPVSGEFLRWKADLSGVESAVVVPAGSLGVPVAIADGGTGGITAAAARVNLAIAGLADANVFTADQTIESTDAGAGAGPDFILDRNSASPAVNDVLGALVLRGRDAGGAAQDYARIEGEIVDPVAATEDGGILLKTAIAGSMATRLRLRQGLFTVGATGGDQGAGTINASAFFDDGVALINIPQATIAAIEAETNENTYVPPDLIGRNPGVAKFACKFDGTLATPITPDVEHNVVDVTDNGTGDYTVNIDTDFSTADYVGTGIARSQADGNQIALAVEFGFVPTVGAFQVQLNNQGGTRADSPIVMVSGHGDQ